MKRALPLALALVAVLAAPGVASAQTATAEGLAEDCNKDGLVLVEKRLVVRGGTGVLARDCAVRMAPHASLVLDRATLTGGDVVFVIADAQAGTRVTVARSTILLGDAGAIQLSPGCCAGEGEPGRSERRGLVLVFESLLRAGTVEVSASIASSGGTAVVHRSILKAVDATFAQPLTVLASLTGTRGRVSVSDSQLVSASGIRLATGDLGGTRAARNVFDAPGTVTITTGAGGSCSSVANTPPIPCS